MKKSLQKKFTAPDKITTNKKNPLKKALPISNSKMIREWFGSEREISYFERAPDIYFEDFFTLLRHLIEFRNLAERNKATQDQIKILNDLSVEFRKVSPYFLIGLVYLLSKDPKKYSNHLSFIQPILEKASELDILGICGFNRVFRSYGYHLRGKTIERDKCIEEAKHDFSEDSSMSEVLSDHLVNPEWDNLENWMILYCAHIHIEKGEIISEMRLLATDIKRVLDIAQLIPDVSIKSRVPTKKVLIPSYGQPEFVFYKRDEPENPLSIPASHPLARLLAEHPSYITSPPRKNILKLEPKPKLSSKWPPIPILLENLERLENNNRNKKQRAVLLQKIGISYVDIGNNESALPYLQEAVGIYEKLGMRKKLREIDEYLALSITNSDVFDNALEAAEDAYDAYVKYGMNEEMTRITGQLIDLMRGMNKDRDMYVRKKQKRKN